MTPRAIILGLLGAVFIATAGYFSYTVPKLVPLGNNFFPIIVFFPLILVAGVINPVLKRLRSWRPLAGSEQAGIVLIMLIACSISGAGMMRYWSRAVFMPVKLNHGNVGWNKAEALSYVPGYLLVNNGQYDDDMFVSAWEGMSLGGDTIGMGDIPWGAWTRPISVWMPVLVLFFIASICMALMVHRQWSVHERLPYPIAQLAGAVMGTDSSAPPGAIFRRRMFWLGAGVILFIHVCNGLNKWTDGKFIEIPMVYNFFEALHQLTWLNTGVWGFGLVHVALWPTLIAFACFIDNDVSFSLGISAIPFWIMGTFCVTSGINLDWNYVDGGVLGWQMAGSFLAVGVTILYLGRRFYVRLLGRAVGLASGGEVRGYETWACRAFLLCGLLLVVLFVSMGLQWPFAAIAIGLFLLGFLVFARMSVESGLVTLQTWWQPLGVVIGLFGAEALGLRTIALIGVFYPVLSFDRHECLMPMIVNGLRICQNNTLTPGRVGVTSVWVLLIVIAVAVPFGLWVDHNWGFSHGYGGAVSAAPSGTFTYLSKAYNKLKPAGQLIPSADKTTWQRLTSIAPDRKFLIAIGLGFGVVLLLSALRMRFTWWPLHPILLLIWGTYILQEVAYSFLLGWFIKRMALKYGVSWRTLKTLMIGVIAGDLAGGALWMIVGAIQYGISGQTPPKYFIFPQ